jgi:hypothetical protein
MTVTVEKKMVILRGFLLRPFPASVELRHPARSPFRSRISATSGPWFGPDASPRRRKAVGCGFPAVRSGFAPMSWRLPRASVCIREEV